MNPTLAHQPILDYLQAVMETYVSLPQTPTKHRPQDRRLALQLYQRGIPLEAVKGALLLAAARRATRPPEAPPLPPIRSLYYFLPVLEEVLQTPIASDYFTYLRSKVLLKTAESKPAATV
jgi:hypothetical protein